MSFDNARAGRRGRKSGGGGVPSPPTPPRKNQQPPTSDVGDALKSAYQRTLGEAIPPEMLDLLGKLG